MPPSPQDIKSRLDKVVDQEGNVQDMGTVLDIVSVLERITMTKEALETTRLGRIINLMRKKTDNEELARRAKKLVKKWQKLVSNHFKNLSKTTDSPGNGSRTSTPVPQINGVIKEQGNLNEKQKLSNEIQKKAGKKRKYPGSSNEGSPQNLEKIDGKGIDGNAKELIELNENLTAITSNIEKGETSNCETIVKNGQYENISCSGLETSSTSDELLSGVSRLKSLNDENAANVIQNINETELVTSGENSLNHDEEQILNEDDNKDKMLSIKLQPAEEEPSDIPEEDLAVKRREITNDFENITSESDGVNGCYDENNKWCTWTEIVTQNNGNLNAFPYVILD